MRWGGGRGEGGGGGGRGGNSAVKNASDAAFSNRALFAFARAMVEPSVYDELQGTIDLVTPPKKSRESSADSTASVAGSVWDAEPAKAAVLALGRCLRLSHFKNEFSKRVANCDRVLGTQLLEVVGQPQSCVPKQAASKKFRCDGFEPQVLDFVWQSL